MMERLTTNKNVSEMGMYELALNSCYIQDGLTRYRDFTRDIDARDFARYLMASFGEWKNNGDDMDNEIVDDDIFDDTMLDNLSYTPNTIKGLIALFYRNLWVMAELREKLKQYEDSEEKGLIPKFHLGDVFWTVHGDGVSKEKIVMLQQKKDGTWKYRFPNTCDYEENDYGKYFFSTKEEAEKLCEYKRKMWEEERNRLEEKRKLAEMKGE